jgi:hypothetical protein
VLASCGYIVMIGRVSGFWVCPTGPADPRALGDEGGDVPMGSALGLGPMTISVVNVTTVSGWPYSPGIV